MALSLDEAYDVVDQAIIFIARDQWVDKWKVQKGVFYYLWLYSVYKKINFNEIANKLEIEPEKQGPYSRSIEGEVEGLIKDGFLDVRNAEEKSMEIRASKSGAREFLNNIKSNESAILQQVKDLVDKLQSNELVFFVYFNPYIPEDVRKYFTSKSEMIDSLKNRKNEYVKRLLSLGVIDQNAANKILTRN
jgi:uncharacterized protein YwgA